MIHTNKLRWVYVLVCHMTDVQAALRGTVVGNSPVTFAKQHSVFL